MARECSRKLWRPNLLMSRKVDGRSNGTDTFVTQEGAMKFSPNEKGPSPTLIFNMCLALCLGVTRVSSALDEAKIHVAGTPNITSFVYHVGKEKGFYREEGIELQPIMAGMLQGIQGLIGGSFDYSQMLGQGGGAIMRGAPLKIIMAFDSRPSWFLLGTKNMKTIRDLRGKQLAVSSFGAALDQISRAAAAIWHGTHARRYFARHRGAAQQTGCVIERRGRRGGVAPPRSHHRAKTGLHQLLFFRRPHRVCLGRSGDDREKHHSETGFRPPFYPRRAQDVLLAQRERKRSCREAGQSNQVLRGRRLEALQDRA
jgi:NMT1/THI5 like protein